ncbi:MAG: hypothetical protein AB7I19_07445 [Planctomycetota bacterium]
MSSPRTYEFQIAPLRGRERVTLDDNSLVVSDTRGRVRAEVELADVTRVIIGEFPGRGMVSRWVYIHHSGKRVSLACNSMGELGDGNVTRYREAIADLVRSLRVAAPNASIESGLDGFWRLFVGIIGGLVVATSLLAYAGSHLWPSKHVGHDAEMAKISLVMGVIGVAIILFARYWRR